MKTVCELHDTRLVIMDEGDICPACYYKKQLNLEVARVERLEEELKKNKGVSDENKL